MKRIIKTTLTFLLGAFAVALACTAPANNTTPPTSTLMAPPATTDIAPHTDTSAAISAAMPAAGAFGAEEDWAVDDLAKMLRLKEKKDDYISPQERREMDKAAQQASETILGFDKDFEERKQNFRRSVRQCGGRITRFEMAAAEKLAGISQSDKDRWSSGRFDRRDQAKVMSFRLLVHAIMKDKLSTEQIACVRNKMHDLAEDHLQKASDLLRPEWEQNLAEFRRQRLMSPPATEKHEHHDKLEHSESPHKQEKPADDDDDHNEKTRVGSLHLEKEKLKSGKVEEKMPVIHEWLHKLRQVKEGIKEAVKEKDKMTPIADHDNLTDAHVSGRSSAIPEKTTVPVPTPVPVPVTTSVPVTRSVPVTVRVPVTTDVPVTVAPGRGPHRHAPGATFVRRADDNGHEWLRAY